MRLTLPPIDRSRLKLRLPPRALSAAVLALFAASCKRDAPESESESRTLAVKPAAVAPEAPATAPTGVVRVLSADEKLLDRPTTAAFRGSDAWVAIGQLSALFTPGQQPTLPFRAVMATASPGSQAIELPGADYYPEGITAASDGTLYIGSILQGGIVKVPPGSLEPQPFLDKGSAKRGVIGMTVDAGRQLLWYCDSNPTLEEAKKAGDLVGVQLSDGKEVARHALPKTGEKAPFCNDVIVGPDGSLWITDSAGGRVLRVPADQARGAAEAQPWASGGEVGPPPSGGSGANGIEWLDGSLIVANVGRGTLVRLDPDSADPLASARVIALRDGAGQPVHLCSPDGLASVPGQAHALIVVENGGCEKKAARVVEVTLDAG